MKDMSQVLRTMPFIVGEVRDPNKDAVLSSVRCLLYRSTIHATRTTTSIAMKFKEILGGNES